MAYFALYFKLMIMALLNLFKAPLDILEKIELFSKTC